MLQKSKFAILLKLASYFNTLSSMSLPLPSSTPSLPLLLLPTFSLFPLIAPLSKFPFSFLFLHLSLPFPSHFSLPPLLVAKKMLLY